VHEDAKGPRLDWQTSSRYPSAPSSRRETTAPDNSNHSYERSLDASRCGGLKVFGLSSPELEKAGSPEADFSGIAHDSPYGRYGQRMDQAPIPQPDIGLPPKGHYLLFVIVLAVPRKSHHHKAVACDRRPSRQLCRDQLSLARRGASKVCKKLNLAFMSLAGNARSSSAFVMRNLHPSTPPHWPPAAHPYIASTLRPLL